MSNLVMRKINDYFNELRCLYPSVYNENEIELYINDSNTLISSEICFEVLDHILDFEINNHAPNTRNRYNTLVRLTIFKGNKLITQLFLKKQETFELTIVQVMDIFECFIKPILIFNMSN